MSHHSDSSSQFSDIPGTTVFTTLSSRRAYQLHRFCQSLMKESNRAEFKADEAAYLQRYPMSAEQRQAVRDRDFNRLVELGGNVFFLFKISNTDGSSVQQTVATMSGMTAEAYAAMMLAGGRSPAGIRSIQRGD
jgi:protocatechuate 4,5-dioxygenase alpha chain